MLWTDGAESGPVLTMTISADLAQGPLLPALPLCFTHDSGRLSPANSEAPHWPPMPTTKEWFDTLSLARRTLDMWEVSWTWDLGDLFACL